MRDGVRGRAAAACSQRSSSEHDASQRRGGGCKEHDAATGMRDGNALRGGAAAASDAAAAGMRADVRGLPQSQRSSSEYEESQVDNLSLRSLPSSCGPTQAGWATQVNHASNPLAM